MKTWIVTREGDAVAPLPECVRDALAFSKLSNAKLIWLFHRSRCACWPNVLMIAYVLCFRVV